MVKYKPKNYKCDNCGREQYTNKKCYGCEGSSFESIMPTPKKFYSIVCRRCEKRLGKTVEEPSIVLCLDCYYRKDKHREVTHDKRRSDKSN